MGQLQFVEEVNRASPLAVRTRQRRIHPAGRVGRCRRISIPAGFAIKTKMARWVGRPAHGREREQGAGRVEQTPASGRGSDPCDCLFSCAREQQERPATPPKRKNENAAPAGGEIDSDDEYEGAASLAISDYLSHMHTRAHTPALCFSCTCPTVAHADLKTVAARTTAMQLNGNAMAAAAAAAAAQVRLAGRAVGCSPCRVDLPRGANAAAFASGAQVGPRCAGGQQWHAAGKRGGGKFRGPSASLGSPSMVLCAAVCAGA